MVKSPTGFQAFALRKPVLKGVLSQGYKVPTPIQRKTIPSILEGKDVIGMSRTGSGKTMAFVLPCLEKLYQLEGKTGTKALVLAPTRELAAQIYRVFKDIGRFTDFKFNLIYGGDSMEAQFAKMLDFPDVVIATPGRLLHLLVEMDMKLSSVEYVVFDEADRLFEMGFHEQLMEILHRLPDYRQTLLFSATLPQQLVDFAKAGLSEPELIRLDVESKLPEGLRNVFIGCRADDKMATLLALLKLIVQQDESTVIFVPTRHHVEYIRSILNHNQIASTYVFSALDQKIRVENVRRFKSGEVNVLIVTDVAARGIDIPLLDNVINYNFPAKPKLFVHRVGRVARAGRSGCAYSIIGSDELAFLYELLLFLDKPLVAAQEEMDSDTDCVYGSIPQSLLDEENDSIQKTHSSNRDVQDLLKVCQNAYKQYLKTREKASGEAVKKTKALYRDNVPIHPVFASRLGGFKLPAAHDTEAAQRKMLEDIKNFKSNSTIFEIDRKKAKASEVISKTRKFFQNVIEKKNKNAELEQAELEMEAEISNEKTDYKDDEFYLPHQSKSAHSEKGLAVNNNSNMLEQSVFSVHGDEEEDLRMHRQREKHWDRKKKKFVGEADEIRAKKFKTENGNWISTSYKSDLFAKWKERNKIADTTVSFDNPAEGETDEKRKLKQRNNEVMRMMSKKYHKNLKGARSELKDKTEIVKQRVIKKRHDDYQEMKKQRKKEHEKKNANNRAAKFRGKTGKAGKASKSGRSSDKLGRTGRGKSKFGGASRKPMRGGGKRK